MIDGVPNRRLYFYQKDTIDPNSCFNKLGLCGALFSDNAILNNEEHCAIRVEHVRLSEF